MGKDVISIKDIEVYAYHGVNEDEKEKGQFFYVSADLFCDTARAGTSDDLSATVNYADVAMRIVDIMTENRFDLIESCAETIARSILRENEAVSGVAVTVRKPQAPIPHTFGDVSVTIRREKHTAFIALGSNMGDKQAYLDGAVKALEGCPDVWVEKVSSFLVTEPYGGVEQDDFLNGAVEIKTILGPYELLDLCHDTENEAKRERKVRWGPRTLDVDILFYDDEVLEDERLTVPHPDMANRDFVLVPLAEIAPGKHHPVTNKTVAEMLDGLKAR